jgi:phospholipid-binding lipoprotein MlaA
MRVLTISPLTYYVFGDKIKMKRVSFPKGFRVAALTAFLCTGLVGCTTTTQSQGEIADPFQGFNKVVFKFNDAADQAVMRPIASGYRTVVPQPARTGLKNFLRNLRAPVNFTNEVLQGDLTGAGTVLTRTTVNTLIGVGGLVDVAAMEGIPYEHEDFGQTLAVWGVDHGAYLVLPLMGPSSMRDGTGLLVDNVFDPLNWYFYNVRPSNEGWAIGRFAAEGLVKREELLDVLDDLRRNSFDYYAAMRSAYVQRRDAMVRDSDTVGNTSMAIPDYGSYE